MEQIYFPQREYKVLVSCMTYNQSKYIEDALNGFAVQQTEFPFVCLVMDDCSSDGEQEVIKSWMTRECDMGKAENLEIEKSHITIVPHKSNPGCHIAFYFLKQNLCGKDEKKQLVTPWRERCEYEALCEGDDYWTDPQKLQKQVDFLDANPEYSMCFHNAIEHWEDGRTVDKTFSDIEDRDYSGPEIYEKWIIPTASTIIRKGVFNSNYYKRLRSNKKFCFGDIILFLACAHEGKLRGFSDVSSVYRRHPAGATFHVDRHIYNRHVLESYRVLGKEYKEIARLKLFRSAKKDFDESKDLYYFYLCFIASPLKAIYRFFFTKRI